MKWGSIKPGLKLNVASRLNLAFAVLCLAIIAVVVLGALGLDRINGGVSRVVTGAAPAQKSVGDLQIELLQISSLAIEHYNTLDAEQLGRLEADFDATTVAFANEAAELGEHLDRLGTLEASRRDLKKIVERSQALFDSIRENMRIYSQSLQAQQQIAAIRVDLQTVIGDLDAVFPTYLDAVEGTDNSELLYDIRDLVVRGSAWARELALVNTLTDFREAQDNFRDFANDYGRVGFQMMARARQEPVIGEFQRELGPLVSQLVEKVTANEGLAPLQNDFLQIKAALRTGVGQTQDGLSTEVALLSRIAARVDAAAGSIGSRAQDEVVRSRLALIAVAAVAVLFCVLVSVLVVRSIRQPLKRLRRYMTQVGEGDFTARFGRHSRDELGDISQATEQLVETLSGMIGRIQAHNQTLSQVAHDTTAISDQTRASVERQRTELDMVVTAINEMTSSIREVASNAEVASREMRDSEQDARVIDTTVQATMTAVSALEEKMASAAEVIRRLDEGVTSIEDILATIRGIAEQTNLLALNAAIEAARAGEQGRGFAVVADEVRTLAGRTQASTEEIRVKIEWMLEQSASAVAVIETSQAATQDVAEQARSAQERFARFMEAMTHLNELNMLIATASEQQSATTEEINRNIVAIREVSEGTAEGAQKAAEQTHQLQNVARDLDQAVQQFKV
ncbi:HAMP domain-containing methyl-accepting chemotaxis protein [Saccharospirillum mangrovi]|uniref:HAMP domain-containing methyl-accepting chemotaxis protein n=1 Tax=Saccharospirillum mangrovi TaxID=2161747 RepID=UPI000D359370|nr:methyl-accepting chemotaxis protein [Saccharospirillum mangrovi]